MRDYLNIMATIKGKTKRFPHVGRAQKKKAIASGKLYSATYSQDKDLYKALGIPSSKSEVFLVLPEEEKKPTSKKAVEAELERLGYHVLSKKEIEASRPLQFPTPVSEANQKKVLREVKNNILKINEEELANIIGCSERTVSSVINGKSTFKKTKSFRDKFNQLVKITNMLLGVFKQESLPQWIRKKSKDFQGKSPLELLTTGHSDELYRWIYAQLEGVYQ